MVGAALIGAGLVGVGAIGASALVSADDPELGASPTSTTTSTTSSTTTSAAPTTTNDVELLDGDDLREFSECIGLPDLGPGPGDLGGDLGSDLEGEWNGELPPLDELLGPDFDLDEVLGDLESELPMLDEVLGDLESELPMLDELLGDLEFELEGEFGHEWQRGLEQFEQFERGTDEAPSDASTSESFEMLDDLVAVMGPDGPVLIDLGDGEAAVTIERDADGEVTITTDGSAAEIDPDDLLTDLMADLNDAVVVPGLPDDVRSCLDELAGE